MYRGLRDVKARCPADCRRRRAAGDPASGAGRVPGRRRAAGEGGNSRGLVCPTPWKRQQDRPLTSRFWPLILNACWLENHKFGLGDPPMARIWKEPYSVERDLECTGHWGHPSNLVTLRPRNTEWMYFVEVCRFTFVFFSPAEINPYLEFYRKKVRGGRATFDPQGHY